MNDTMRRMRERALDDASFRAALLKTWTADDPIAAFCTVAAQFGYTLSVEEVIASGEEFSCNQTKSTNGGNNHPYDCFDDAFDMFMISIS